MKNLLLTFLFLTTYLLTGCTHHVLSQNTSIITLDRNGTIEEYECFYQEDIDVFLAGEDHRFVDKYIINEELIKYFHQNKDINYFLIESGFNSIVYLDQYIQTGDIDILNIYHNNLKGTMAFTPEHFEFYKNLYEYNKNNNETNKIHLIGIDVDHQINTAFLGISLFFKENPPSLFEEYKDYFSNTDYSKIYKKSNDLLKIINENKEESELYFQENLELLKIGLNNLLNTMTFYNEYSSTINDYRDTVMIENFLKNKELLNEDKFFGQLGTEHVLKDYCNSKYMRKEDKRFAILLKQNNLNVKSLVINNNKDQIFNDLKDNVIEILDDNTYKDAIIWL